MTYYYDDNFGHWDGCDEWGPDGDDMRDFYEQVQRESVKKECSICGRIVNLRPDYDKCNSCCDKLERGWQY